MKYRSFGEPKGDCNQCIAWYAEVQRVSLLLERLAEDHFPDQASFDAWVQRQMHITLGGPRNDL